MRWPDCHVSSFFFHNKRRIFGVVDVEVLLPHQLEGSDHDRLAFSELHQRPPSGQGKQPFQHIALVEERDIKFHLFCLVNFSLRYSSRPSSLCLLSYITCKPPGTAQRHRDIGEVHVQWRLLRPPWAWLFCYTLYKPRLLSPHPPSPYAARGILPRRHLASRPCWTGH